MQPAVLAAGACAGCCGAEALRGELARAKEHFDSLEATVRRAALQPCIEGLRITGFFHHAAARQGALRQPGSHRQARCALVLCLKALE